MLWLLSNPIVKASQRHSLQGLKAATGVFAARSIRRGELVETAHCIYISKQEYDQHMRLALPVPPQATAGSFMTARCCMASLRASSFSIMAPKADTRHHDFSFSMCSPSCCDHRHTVLEHYLFSSRGEYFLALGVGSLFNHSCRPCLDYRVLRDQLVITYTAARDIQVGYLRVCESSLLALAHALECTCMIVRPRPCCEIRAAAI